MPILGFVFSRYGKWLGERTPTNKSFQIEISMQKRVLGKADLKYLRLVLGVWD
jgi:hypothetical protein